MSTILKGKKKRTRCPRVTCAFGETFARMADAKRDQVLGNAYLIVKIHVLDGVEDADAISHRALEGFTA